MSFITTYFWEKETVGSRGHGKNLHLPGLPMNLRLVWLYLLLGCKFQLNKRDDFLGAGVAPKQNILPWSTVSFPEHFRHEVKKVFWHHRKWSSEAHTLYSYSTSATPPLLSPTHREATAPTVAHFHLCSHPCFLNHPLPAPIWLFSSQWWVLLFILFQPSLSRP